MNLIVRLHYEPNYLAIIYREIIMNVLSLKYRFLLYTVYPKDMEIIGRTDQQWLQRYKQGPSLIGALYSAKITMGSYFKHDIFSFNL